jgi:hypothetical protein
MYLLEKKRIGRELESLARKYSRTVMKTITTKENIKTLKAGKIIDDYIELRPLGLDRPNLIGIELEIDSNLDVNGIYASGAFQMVPGEPEISYIRVTASLPSPFTRRHLARFYDELIEIMRHEIEHSTQDPERIDQIADNTDDPFGSKENMLNYYASPEEIAGHVTGWMKRAKKRREPVKDTISREVGYIAQQAEREGMSKKDANAAGAELLRKFVEYAVDRYGA